MSTAVRAIEVRGVAGNIGAEISGVRIGPDLPGPVVRQIRDAVLAHKVIFFRGQHHLDDDAHAGFAQLFGELSPLRKPKDTHVHAVDGDVSRATVWHTDNTKTARPHAFTVLRSIVLPPYGGDTAWANTANAYQRMSPEWRELAEGLRAVHSNNMVAALRLRKQAMARSKSGEQQELPSTEPDAVKEARQDAGIRADKVREAEHPVVHVHPETGERALLLGAFARTILGRDDSDSLLALLQSAVTPMDNTVRWQWALGDVAMWDNRATQHCAIADYGSHKRLMRRVTIRGDIPVGVDGRPSVVLKGPGAAE